MYNGIRLYGTQREMKYERNGGPMLGHRMNNNATTHLIVK